MNTRCFVAALLSLSAALPSEAFAEASSPTPADTAVPARYEERPNLLSLDVMGFTGFTGRYAGDFAVSYERIVGERHGIVIQGGYAHVHGDPTHIHVGSARLGYRIHILPEADVDPFVGVLVGARFGAGRFDLHHEGGVEGEHAVPHRYSLVAASATAHFGLRWSITDRVALGSRLGVGWAGYWLGCDDGAGTDALACEGARDMLAPTPVALDTELSIGVAF